MKNDLEFLTNMTFSNLSTTFANENNGDTTAAMLINRLDYGDFLGI